MRVFVTALLAAFALPVWGQGGTVVFEQAGFPTVASERVPRAVLAGALGGIDRPAVFADIVQLREGAVLKGATLLVLPYGSAVPAAAWSSIERYLHGGGNLLLLGGQPLRVPVLGEREGEFVTEAPQDSYSRVLDFRHSYAVPLGSREIPGGTGAGHFHWRAGYEFLPPVAVKAQVVFAEEGRLQGLGYLDAADGTHLAAPVITADLADHTDRSEHAEAGGGGGRVVALPFTPAPGYWGSSDGVSLIRTAARYAAAGAVSLSLEAKYSALRPGEVPELTLHLRGAAGAGGVFGGVPGSAKVELLRDGAVLETVKLSLGAGETDVPVPFRKPLPVGLYTVRAVWGKAGERPQEFAENGFVVEEADALATGAALGTHGDFLSLGGKPFLPVGTNYFTTEENGWDFSGPRNDAVWERDFADMERHGVNFVRTGVWMSNAKFIEPATGGVNERFLRNLEAYLAAAHRHNMVVNFTCFAFVPGTGEHHPAGEAGKGDGAAPMPPNPYLDAGTVAAEQAYVESVVRRFRKVPWLSWDLINEPSFSNSRTIFHGNVPNGDPTELSAWQGWLETHYRSLPKLADAWRVTPESLGGWSSIPLPKPADLGYSRYGNAGEARALDYNLFAQDSFSGWVRGMVAAIRATGSTQPVNVGQDEGGVTDRVLNQFYATAGVAFTTNHTYWQDDALLWDSLAAKRPGMPNITGETGYQPAWNPDGGWRYDELTGTALMERKWALGFAAGSSGAVQWDWAREVDFGMQRSDGSAKVWEGMMREMGRFAAAAAPYATGLTLPEVAIVLPQSLQLSVLKAQALEAQQTAVRVLYGYSRAEAYAVGEYQTDLFNTLDTPKLILLPCAYGLTDKAWSDIEARVRAGAVLLVTGPFSADEHLHATDRAETLGLKEVLVPLQQREQLLESPAGAWELEFGGKTTGLDRAVLPDGKTWAELPLGKGRILFSALPLELNSNMDAVAAVYAYALKTAGVQPMYKTGVKTPGVLICPTKLPHATLYVLTSETGTMPVAFQDERSGKSFSGTLGAGRAALLLVRDTGELAASYGWESAR